MVFDWLFGKPAEDFETWTAMLGSELDELKLDVQNEINSLLRAQTTQLSLDEMKKLLEQEVVSEKETKHEIKGLLKRIEEMRKNKKLERPEKNTLKVLHRHAKRISSKNKRLDSIIRKLSKNFDQLIKNKPETNKKITEANTLLSEIQTELDEMKKLKESLQKAHESIKAKVEFYDEIQGSESFRESIKDISKQNAKKMLNFLDKLSSGHAKLKTTQSGWLSLESKGSGEVFRVILVKHKTGYRLAEFFNDHNDYDKAVDNKKITDYAGWSPVDKSFIQRKAS